MKQVSLGLILSTKKARKRELLVQVNKVVLCDVPAGVFAPHWPKSHPLPARPCCAFITYSSGLA
jgi:hypothetical protein